MNSVRSLDLRIDENDPETVKQIAKTVRPEWKDKDVQVKAFSGGISNKLLGSFVPPDKENVILTRIYGAKTELIVDRVREKETFEIMHKAGCGPKLHAEFQNGIAYDYIPGVTLDPVTVRDEKVYRLVASEMARMHCIKPEGMSKSSGLFPKLRRFIAGHPDQFEDPSKQERFITRLLPRDGFLEEVRQIEEVLAKLDQPVVFSHNDLLLGNIIYNEKKGKVSFIDYEYAMENYLAFDIGNHFCEFVGIDEVDYNLYPDKEFQLKWIRAYLKARSGFSGENRAVTTKDVERMYAIASKFALASHLFWATWAVVQAYNSTIDFDFMDYAIIRFEEYKRRKEEFLAIPIPE